MHVTSHIIYTNPLWRRVDPERMRLKRAGNGQWEADRLNHVEDT